MRLTPRSRVNWRNLAFAPVILASLASAASAIAPVSTWRWPAFPSGVASPPVPADNAMNAAKVALGRRLFHDRALSADNSLSCADCHQQSHGFSDGQATHAGVTGEMGVRNVPGLANVGWRKGLTWADANLNTLEEQAMVPMTGTKPVEMGMAANDAQLKKRLAADPCYARLFQTAFPDRADAISFAQVSAALGAFQRTLIAFGTPYDRHRRGESGAMSAMAIRGMREFGRIGCASCHSGPHFTDDATHYTGTAAPGETDASAYGGKPLPPGFEPPVEQFRTPGLRNVAVTGPWLHDGSATSIDMAVRRHAASALADADMPAIIAFLEALTDRAFLADARFGPPGKICPV